MNSELQVVLEPGIAQKLQFAVNRTKGTLTDIEWLSTGDNFKNVSLLARGEAELVIKTKNALPSTPDQTPDFFVPPSEQLRLARKWNMERNWGFTEVDFAKLGDAPAWPAGMLCAIVLEVTLDTVGQTFEEGWNCAKSVQPNNWRWDSLKSDADSLRLLKGIKHVRGLRWRVVHFAAHWDKVNGIRPIDARDAKDSPAQSILWSAAYFPKWVQAMDGDKVPYSWIPGYEANVPGCEAWAGVPDLSWDRGDREVELSAFGRRSLHYGWAVPAFRE